jgi:hypothetical protein
MASASATATSDATDISTTKSTVITSATFKAAQAATDKQTRELEQARLIKADYEQAIDALNERYAIVTLGSQTVVAQFLHDGRIDFFKFDELKRRLIKEWIDVPVPGKAPKRRPLADTWLRSSRGNQYSRAICGMPGRLPEPGPNDLNLWRGFTIEPKPGDWSSVFEFIRTIICNGDADTFAYVLNWMAALIQRPGERGHSALIMLGREGIGKGFFADQVLGACFRDEYLHLMDPQLLTGEFTGHLSNRALVFADESAWGDDRAAVNKLKALVTEPQTTIHRKGLTPYTEPNSMHVIISSNDKVPIAISDSDRRYVVLDVSDRRIQDTDYFATLACELNCGGRAAMLYDLLEWPVDWDLLRRPPVTAAKRTLKQLSMSFLHRWWLEYLQTADEKTWRSKMPKDALYKEYAAAFKEAKPAKEALLLKEAFGHELKRIFTLGWSKTIAGAGGESCPYLTATAKVLVGAERKNAYAFPSLSECRLMFMLATGTEPEWDTPSPVVFNPGLTVAPERSRMV